MTVEPSRITEHTEIADHVVGGLALLTDANRKTVIKAIGAAWLSRVQEIEGALWGLLVDTTITTAARAQLDQLGVLLGLGRGDMTDTVYRRALRGVVLANRSHGTADEHLAILDLVLGAGTYALAESFPAGLLVTPADPLGSLRDALAEILRRARAGGVGTGLVDPPEGTAFAFSDADELVEADTVHGWSDTAGLTGGEWAGAIEV